MDIIVTLPIKYDFGPKLRIAGTKFGIAYWHIGRKPKNAARGEHIYFLQNDSIRWRAVIDWVDEDIDFINVEELPQPWVTMKGFRGFRYYREEH